ncbi:TPA: hypothetical protein EYP44_00740 [Candidatus Bathyarchaeota archaeon]|nr:hypothetical protein [Candidatus Bathyarchaeota archaeon]
MGGGRGSLLPAERVARQAAATCICAALYCIGSLLTAYIPTGYFVQFRPAIAIPTVFAVLFGPFVGGVGAAVGTFIASIYRYGHPFLTIFSGTPANLVGFWVLGHVVKRLKGTGARVLQHASVGLGSVAILTMLLPLSIEVKAVSLLLLVFLECTLLGLYRRFLRYRWACALVVGGILGMAAGSLIIAGGLYLVASLLTPGVIRLPAEQARGVAGFADPTHAVLFSFLIVFLPLPIALLVAIPVIETCWKVFPYLRAEFFEPAG